MSECGEVAVVSGERIDAIRARLTAATPGPWRWRGNKAAKEIDLQTVDRGGIFVMSFRRWGTQGAMPWFQSRPAGRIEPALERAIVPQSHNPWFIDGIDHPDAELIANAPADIEFLLGEVRRLRAELATAREQTDEIAEDFAFGQVGLGEQERWVSFPRNEADAGESSV